MNRFKRDLIKICPLSLALLLFFAIWWVSMSTADAHAATHTSVTSYLVKAQETPTVDATVTALSKEELTQEVDEQQHTWNNWLWSNIATIFSSVLSTLVIVSGALFGLWRWYRDKRDAQDKELKEHRIEREKRAEERFQMVVAGLGDEKQGVRIGAATLLRTFLHPDYEQFFIQVFDLVVITLRISKVDESVSEPFDSLRQALGTVFREAFPLVRTIAGDEDIVQVREPLNARRIQLDNLYLARADLATIWMPRAYLRGVSLFKANLSFARLKHVKLSSAYLREADFSYADLREADLSEVDARLTNFSYANLQETNFERADLRGANLQGTNLIDAVSLKDTNLLGANGLTNEHLAICKAKGAIVGKEIFV